MYPLHRCPCIGLARDHELVPYWWSIIFSQRHCIARALRDEGCYVLQLAAGCRLTTHQYFSTTSTWWDWPWSMTWVGLERGDELVRSGWSNIHGWSYSRTEAMESWYLFLVALRSRRICWWQVQSEIGLGSRNWGFYSWWVDTEAKHHSMVHMGSWHWVSVVSGHLIGPQIWIA